MRLNERPNSPPYSTPRAFMVQLLFNSNLYPYPAGELHGEARLCNVKANWPMAKLSDFSQTFAVQASRDVM